MQKQPKNPLELVSQIESVRLANWLFKTMFKVIALIVGLVTSSMRTRR